jgi:hypothetical protein
VAALRFSAIVDEIPQRRPAALVSRRDDLDDGHNPSEVVTDNNEPDNVSSVDTQCSRRRLLSQFFGSD